MFKRRDVDAAASSDSHLVLRTGGLMVLSLVLAVVLAEIYSATHSLGFGSWQGAMAFHLIGSIALVGAFYQRGVLSQKFCFLGVSQKAPGWFGDRPWLAYLPAVILLAGASLLGALSGFGGAGPERGAATTPIAWVTLLPLVEELFFRGFVGSIYRKILPGFGGIWLSAATFALAHTNLTMAHLVEGAVGVPLGPFLLGLLCEGVYYLSGSLVPAVVLHASANATVVIFTSLDARWLSWLEIFYI